MKVLLVDDHPMILGALQSVIGGLLHEPEIATASSADAARRVLRDDPAIDLVLLDLNLGDGDGFELLSEFRAAHPAVPVVIVSASDRHSDVMRAIDLGAMGFVPKRASTAMLAEALQRVLAGGVYVPPPALRSTAESAPAAGDVAAERARIAALPLTPRQREVLELLMAGQSNKLIARQLDVSVETVKDHVAAILRVLDVGTRTQAVLAITHPAPRDAGPAGTAPRPLR